MVEGLEFEVWDLGLGCCARVEGLLYGLGGLGFPNISLYLVASSLVVPIVPPGSYSPDFLDTVFYG